MSTIPCACGMTLPLPSDTRRTRCPGCSRIHDPRSLGWHPAQEGVAELHEIETKGMDRPLDWYPVDWRYSPDDLDRIRWGMRRRSMEDKWVACVAGNELFILRSWSGVLCYKAELDSHGITRVGVVRVIVVSVWRSACSIAKIIARRCAHIPSTGLPRNARGRREKGWRNSSASHRGCDGRVRLVLTH